MIQSPNIVFGSALAVIAIGYILKSLRIIREYDAKYISKFMMYSTFPALLLGTMSRVELKLELLWMPIISFCFGSLGSFIGYHYFKKEKETKNRGILTMGCTGFNLSLFAFPLIEGIWGLKGIAYAALFDLGNSFINLALNYGVGSSISDIKKEGKILPFVLKKIALFAPFQAMIIGLAMNLMNLEFHPFLGGIIDTLAAGNKPIVLLLMGIYFSIRLPKELFIQVGKVMAIRYLLGFSIGLGLYYFSNFDIYFKNLALIFLILPAGLTLIAYSDLLKFNTKIAGAIVNFTMVVSFTLMWILVYAFKMV
ncbi:MAG: hypothetical protein RIR51_249 [Bacteroidota bacterium]|jgi:predicted permease